MPFGNTTPEALVGRSDSRNPATTCRGMTSVGRPCRRGLAAHRTQSAPVTAKRATPVIEHHALDASYFCWQHKDQVHDIRFTAGQTHNTAISFKLMTVTERKSLDSLTGRLGLVQLENMPSALSGPKHVPLNDKPKKKSSQSIAPVPRHDRMSYQHHNTHFTRREADRAVLSDGLATLFACFGVRRGNETYYEVHRYHSRSEMRLEDAYKPDLFSSRLHHGATTIQAPPRAHQPTYRKPVPQQRTRLPVKPQSASKGSWPSLSATQRLISYIPLSLTPATTALLLSELSKPMSPHDGPGYIYMFWLTDQDTVLPGNAASLLLNNSAILDRRTTSTSSKIRLKIGRANNVHRRMTEWTQQCGQSLSLVRWYPYVSDSPTTSPIRPAHSGRPVLPGGQSSEAVRKVPYVSRVERLIHLELADKRVKRDCVACGKEHREWFEVDASSAGVGAVDECIRRWVRWAEQDGQVNRQI